jgi:pimeloyl-ACP methyl ester carboxylesterase
MIGTSELFRTIGNLKDYAILPRLSALTTPTLLLYGDEDMVAEETPRKIKNSIRNAELRIFRQCKHWPHLEQLDAVVTSITDFKQRCE